MKITRRQLRQLIAEATYKFIVDPEGVATPSDVAFASGTAKDKRIAGSHPKLGDLMRQGGTEPGVGPEGAAYRKQGRELAGALGLEEPLTPAEETAVDSLGVVSMWQDQYEADVDIDNIINLIKRGKSGMRALKTFGAAYVKDILSNGSYSGDLKELQHIANTLGCGVHELGCIPMEKERYDFIPLFHQLSNFLYSSASRRVVQDTNGNQSMLLYNYNGVEILLHMDQSKFHEFRTLYFCSK